MKKIVLMLGGILLFTNQGDIQAKRVWFLNLTKHPQTLTYFKKKTNVLGIKVDDWEKDTFTVNGRSKSDGHEIGSSYTHFGKKRPASKTGFGPTNSDVTVVRFYSANPKNVYEEKIIADSIYKSPEVKKLIYTYILQGYKVGKNKTFHVKGRPDTKLDSYKDIQEWMLEKTITNW